LSRILDFAPGLDLGSKEIIETAAKHEFLYRRGKINRQSKKAYAIDKKQFNFKAKKRLIEEQEQKIKDIYTKPLKEFCEFADCQIAEFEMFCKSFEAELKNANGIATNNLHAQLGLKIPFLINNELLRAARGRSTQMGRELSHVLKSENIYQLVREPVPLEKPNLESETHRFLLEEANQLYEGRFKYHEHKLDENDHANPRWTPDLIKIAHNDID